ncbi:uncharacterized protein LOC111902120 [Lactuca sativa]|uniref:uncharacterized protein LOC111902120 n=1 Tax=Lactuca sativa TaxID=4236 RepID=UPI000CD929D0|nr:uncharacterized protein LOC111902120 [Lactuca sativa]
MKNSDQNAPGDHLGMFFKETGKKFRDKYGDHSGIMIWGYDVEKKMWIVNKNNFEDLKIASSFIKKAKGFIDPRTNKTLVNVVFPPTKQAKRIPLPKHLPEGTLDIIQFWVYDEAIAYVVIKLKKNQFRIVDPNDLLKFGELGREGAGAAAGGSGGVNDADGGGDGGGGGGSRGGDDGGGNNYGSGGDSGVGSGDGRSVIVVVLLGVCVFYGGGIGVCVRESVYLWG